MLRIAPEQSRMFSWQCPTASESRLSTASWATSRQVFNSSCQQTKWYRRDLNGSSVAVGGTVVLMTPPPNPIADPYNS
eukprot:SAG22_NODE_1626_length_3956_cov_2.706767_7_plen_78_part_00